MQFEMSKFDPNKRVSIKTTKQKTRDFKAMDRNKPEPIDTGKKFNLTPDLLSPTKRRNSTLKDLNKFVSEAEIDSKVDD
jgi:hypothetical protein